MLVVIALVGLLLVDKKLKAFSASGGGSATAFLLLGSSSAALGWVGSTLSVGRSILAPGVGVFDPEVISKVAEMGGSS